MSSLRNLNLNIEGEFTMKSISEILDSCEFQTERMLKANKDSILDLTVSDYYAGVRPKKFIKNGCNLGFGTISKADADKLCAQSNVVFNGDEIVFFEKSIEVKHEGKPFLYTTFIMLLFRKVICMKNRSLRVIFA